VEHLVEKPEDEIAAEGGGLLELLSVLVEEYEEVNPAENRTAQNAAYLTKRTVFRRATFGPFCPRARVS
jgi:hypothetical protein